MSRAASPSRSTLERASIWRHARCGAYRVPWQKKDPDYNELPMVLDGRPSTLGAIFSYLYENKATVERECVIHTVNGVHLSMGADIYIAGDKEIAVWAEDSASTRFLRFILSLSRDGLLRYEAQWFYYDNHPGSLRFFVVIDSTIIRHDVAFFTEWPWILEGPESPDPPREEALPGAWRASNAWTLATEAYWYRKFYMETAEGQMMVLRPDKPPLFHFDRKVDGPQKSALALASLARIESLLLICALLLAEVAFPAVKVPIVFVLVAVGACAVVWAINNNRRAWWPNSLRVWRRLCRRPAKN